MTLENTIQAMFDHYPSLFKERADCLDHLFCTVGTEYSWKDGELVPDVYDATDQPKHPLKDGRAFQYRKTTILDDANDNAILLGIAQAGPVLASSYVNPELKDQYYHIKERRQRWYFYQRNHDADGSERMELYKDYANIWNFPADIKPDWYDGIQECLQLLLEDGIITKDDIDQVEQRYHKAHANA